jgi:hypothetical protein
MVRFRAIKSKLRTPCHCFFLTGRVGRIEASSTFCVINFVAVLSVSIPTSTCTRPSTALRWRLIVRLFQRCRFHQAHSCSMSHIIPISEYLMKKMLFLVQIGDASYPVCDAGFSGSEFGVQGAELLPYRGRL